ncbi:MAG TPA: hypothetical protein VNV84_05835 [Candidatus Acidoferrales bacterium]|jgi:hypothetical protein|nr:hypothetical protein [Candidatus Acidoferrales bacterium]
MSDKKAIRYVVVPVALLSLLVLATLGCVWHHHASSAAANCSVCHLSHQAFEHPVASDRAPALGPVGSSPEPREPEFVSGPTISRIPARAPPAA